MNEPTRPHPPAGTTAAQQPPPDPTGTVLQSDPPSHFRGGAAAPPAAAGAGRYALHTRIAAGGMGEVFAATDLVLNRDVAVKVLRPDLRDRPAVAARFVEEARITGQLQHPGIPPVHDLGTLPDGRPFLAMKLVKGRTLAELLKDRPDPYHLLAAFEQVCQAVAFAHERSVIHRDLKPANVMVGKFGEAQVMDWGLAKVLGEPGPVHAGPAEEAAPVSVIRTDREGSSLTQAGSLLGTPAYMPPEQAKGDVAWTDARSDVFALGAVLCELLTGKPPYVAPTAAEVHALALTAQLGPAFERLAGCGADPELVALCTRCLSAEAAARPADAGEVAKAVAAFRAGADERARAADLARARAEERRKRARVQLALAGAIGLLLLGGGAFAWWEDRQAADRKAEREREEARHAAERELEGQRHRAEREREEVRTREAATAALNEAEAALRADDMPAADAALARAKERLGDAGPADLRNRFADLVRDRDMIEAMETLADGRVRRGELAGEAGESWSLAKLFRKYGLDLAAGDPDEMAARVNRSPIRGQLLAGLDSLFPGTPFPDEECPRLLALVRRVDPEPTRTAIREAIAARDQDRLLDLVHELRPPVLTPGLAVLINHQSIPHEVRRRLLVRAWRRHPDHFGLNEALAYSSSSSEGPGVEITPEDRAAAVGHARVLVALRPKSPRAYTALADLLQWAGRSEEALAALREAEKLLPRGAIRYSLAGAIRARYGDDAELDYLLAELKAGPDADAHSLLANALDRRGRTGEALVHFRRAAELEPANTGYQLGQAMALKAKGDLDGAAAAARLAAAGENPPGAYTLVVAWILREQGKYREALELLEGRLAGSPAALEDLRVAAAALAALAGTEGGVDPYPREQWPALRRKALAMVREVLAGHRKGAAGPYTEQGTVLRWVTGWLEDPAFARLRHPYFLAALPPDEAREWLALRAEVRAFRAKLAAAPVAPPPRPR